LGGSHGKACTPGGKKAARVDLRRRADDDGAVSVPVGLAAQVIEAANKHHEWEDFSRERLAAAGDLRRYYPLSDAARPEYEAWKKQHGR
jgi:hypothetical protein